MSARYRVGVDVGGTFTDFVLLDTSSGTVRVAKVPTTPEDQSVGILDGLGRLGIDIGEIGELTHGTTVATNALIERDGARTAFLTTEGFRDTLEIRRTNREELYDAQWAPPPALVPRRHRLEIRERMRWDGAVDTALDEQQLAEVVETLRLRDVESVAVCLLHSYEDPGHEQRVAAAVRAALPDAFVTCSHELSQEFREFERGSTVAANAFVGPKVKRYMTRLETRLAEAGCAADVSIMQSNGGVCSIAEAAQAPVKLARSGPAGGAMALRAIAEQTGRTHLVGVDIGGTSADVALVVDGEVRWASPFMVEWGMPLLLPSVDVVSIGAGGGSIAWIDAGGVVKMGPASAGAVPGPACYGRGGTQPTSTDAHVALGRVADDELLSGDMALRHDLARAAIAEHIAEPMGLSVAVAAEGMLRILDTAMLQAVRFLTLEKGYDPRDFTLVALGGGGAMHAAALAGELGMREALVPVNPGVLSAWGMLTVDLRQDRSRTVLERRAALDAATLNATLGELREQVLDAFDRQGAARSAVALEYVLDLQYLGQVYALPVSLARTAAGSTTAAAVDDAALDAATARFHHEHRREYGHADPEQEVQVVHARVFGRAAVRRAELGGAAVGGEAAAGPLVARSTRDVVFDGRAHPTAIHHRDDLTPGVALSGPAIVTEASSTTVVPPGCQVTVDSFSNLVITTTGPGGQA